MFGFGFLGFRVQGLGFQHGIFGVWGAVAAKFGILERCGILGFTGLQHSSGQLRFSDFEGIQVRVLVFRGGRAEPSGVEGLPFFSGGSRGLGA